jgi:HemK-like putative methylase
MSLEKEAAWLLQEKYHGSPSLAYEADKVALATGTPLAYLIGNIPFLGTTIWLDSKPLIPRTETEYWIEQLIRDFQTRNVTPHSVLDLCAGSGCIGISLARAFPDTEVTFVEIDRAHHATIKKNWEVNGLSPRTCHIIGGDLYSDLTPHEYDLIVTNPPYIDPAHDRSTLEVRIHEPSIALYGGLGGTELITNILTTAPAFLSAHGELWLEHEPEQVAYIQKIAMASGFICSAHNDQYGIKRYSRLVLQ